MFPNVRLMVVAILAAIAGIGCGLGLFATFRVNHEPLARLAEGSPPLQLAFDNPPLGSDARAPLEARLPVSGAGKVIAVPMIIPTPSLEPSHEPSPVPSPTPSPAADQGGADSATAEHSSVPQAAIGADAANQSNGASFAISVLAEQATVRAEASAPSQQQPVAAIQDQQADQQPAASAVTAPPAEQTAAINADAEDQQPATKPIQSAESKAAKPAARAARVAPARRAARTVRARRTTVTVAAQPAYQYSQPTYSQPIYTWTDGTTRSQSIKRIQIKRRRTAKKVAPTAPSSPAAATAGLSGSQY